MIRSLRDCCWRCWSGWSRPSRSSVVSSASSRTIWRGKRAWYRRGELMEYRKVGTAKGPGEHPHEFVFITPDDDGHCKIGEFVFYLLHGLEGQRTVLGRITRRSPVRLL